MKKLFAILLCVMAFAFSCALASAQTSSSLVVDAASLTPVNADAVTGLALDPIVKDRSNRPCARIKLHVNRMTPEEIREIEVRTIGGNVIVMKQQPAQEGNGLIIELTAKPETRFYLHHDKLGDSNPVNIKLEGNKEYRMEAWSEQKLPITIFCPKPGAEVYLDGNYRGQIGSDNHLTIPDVPAGRHKLDVKLGSDQHIQNIEVSSEKVFFNAELRNASQLQGFVVFKVTPADALVEFDGEPLFLNSEGRAQKLVRYGTYTYTVSAKDHHTVTDELTVDSGQTVREVTLKMSHGWINVDGTNVQGAYVYIDSELAGQAPLKNFPLSSGSHSIRVLKQMYEAYEAKVTVRDGETTQVTPVLKSDAAEITLVADAGAEIYVNGELKGTGSWKGPMATGDYLVECKKKGYASSTDAVTISRDMTTRIIRLTSLEPSRGILVISSTPMEADVYIDGVHAGKTPQYKTDVPVGTREVKVMMDGYETWKENVQVLENHAHEMDIALKQLKGSALRKAKQEQNVPEPQPQESPEPQVNIQEEPAQEEPEVELITLKQGEKTANSYIISQPGEYDIPAVRGNTSQSVGRVASAEVLWESFGTSVAPSIGDLVRDVTYADGRIYFKTSDNFREGNAVIAALDESGAILWSWHIWLTDQPAEQAYGEAGFVMDRNLGATSATPGDVGALGLLYQWGRKDPFMASASIDSDKLAVSTGTWPSAVESDYTIGSIGYAISHPTTFISRNEINGDWQFTGTSSTDDTRWKPDMKTIYDPCPAGWRLMDGGKEGMLARGGFVNTTFDYDHWGMSQQVSPETSAWYPATGYRSDVDAALYSASRYGYYWSATPSDYNAYSLYFSGNGSVNPADYYNRAYAFAVRCQKDM